ncbi:hypothetical protein [Hyphomonas sp.]|uniref:hypothetical protein n=1 Tax=Hyphomonas sp. TaxID=87 RepID=UPI0025C12393|nr:hypothetical protein [Hyphomonas sp.]
MEKFGFLLWILLIAPAACAPVSRVAGSPDQASLGHEQDYFPSIEGEYAMGPAICDDSVAKDVLIQNGEFWDKSGSIEPARFRIDRVESWEGTRISGPAAGTARIFLGFTEEADGSISLAVFTEVPSEIVQRAKSESGLASPQSSSINHRPALLFSRLAFDSRPTDAEISSRLADDSNDEFFVLESCS